MSDSKSSNDFFTTLGRELKQVLWQDFGKWVAANGRFLP